MASNAATLKGMNKNDLVQMVQSLQTQVDDLNSVNKTLVVENAELRKVFDIMSKHNERLEKLEKEFNRNLQYQRRDTIEITGIPKAIPVEDLETEVVKIYNAAMVKVHGQTLRPLDIQACHRIGKKKEVTIVKFVSRKFAYGGLVSGKNLKGVGVYGAGTNVYINNSFCDQYRHLNFLIRGIKKNNLIHHYKVKKGTNLIQVREGDEYQEIEHFNDLVRLGLVNPDE